ncbi:glutaredoxin domain-containing protein [uncultured Litoreibacter sp.]|uniref:glutaredoxin domain-containing protein n=1 Tax=uncultured Litoreibacter sp. TaxID=1392394 RepID=UPI00260565F6|nr:glutaredoxin domain-containing protein [uncultured Litoreibacter sp.]
MADEIEDYLADIFSKHRVVLFMNGTLDAPMDAESMMARDLLSSLQVEFHPVNLSRDPRLLPAVQKRSEWEQVAQVFIDGTYFIDSFNLGPALKSKQFDKYLTSKNVHFDKAAADNFRDMNK